MTKNIFFRIIEHIECIYNQLVTVVVHHSNGILE